MLVLLRLLHLLGCGQSGERNGHFDAHPQAHGEHRLGAGKDYRGPVGHAHLRPPTHATACYLNGNKRAVSGRWVTATQTRTRTDNLYCTGDGGTSATVPATLTVMPKPTPVPATPATPTGPSTSTGTHTVSWTAVTGATSYQVQSRKDRGDWTVHARQSTLSKDFSNQAAGRWDYQVRACNRNGAQCSGWSSTLTITVAAPTPLSVSPNPSTDGSYTVSWGHARCFNIPFGSRLCRILQERVGATGTWTTVSGLATSATSHTVSNQADGTYYYRMLISNRVVAASEAVTVKRATIPTATLSWSPTQIKTGAGATLTWASTNASACYLNGERVPRAPSAAA